MKNPKMSCSARKTQDQICPAAKQLTDCSAENRSDPTYILPHPGLFLPTLVVAGGGRVGTSNLSSRRDLRLLLDFGRRGLEEKPSTGCPLPKGETGKRTVQKKLSFQPPEELFCHQPTPRSLSVWRKGVTSTTPPHGASCANTTGKWGEHTELAVGITAVQTHWVMLFQKSSSLAILVGSSSLEALCSTVF